MSYKYIIGAGCSFLESHLPWFSYFPSEKYINMSKGGCGNEFIKQQLVYKVDELIYKGIKPSEMLVCAQWTGISRQDFLVSREQTITPNDFNDDFNVTQLGTDVPVFGGWVGNRSDKNIGYIHSGGGNNFAPSWKSKSFEDDFFMNYFKYLANDYDSVKRYLDCVLFLQSFCKSLKINYVMTNAWNPFQNDVGVEEYVYPYFDHMFRRIDENHMIWVKSDFLNGANTTKGKMKEHGGMWQYIVDKDGINWDNDHPNEEGQKIWGEYILEELTRRKLL